MSGQGGTLRIFCVGWGAIMSHAAALMAERVPAARIVGIGVRDCNPAQRRSDWPADARLLDHPEGLETGFADLVIEAAGAGAVLPWGLVALERAKIFAPLSVGAFANGDCLERLEAAAHAHGTRIMLPSGAIGGIDALRSMSFAGLDSVTHQIIKPARAWVGTEAERLVDLVAISEATCFLRLPAREAAIRFPQNANVCAMVALAGLGLDRTEAHLVADPVARTNSHIISAHGPSGKFSIRLDNDPLPRNPKSSQMSALSLVRLVEQLTASVVW